MALLVGGGLLVMFIIPSSVFCSLENWHIIDSVYYCFVTLSTIGFGDYVAGLLLILLMTFQCKYSVITFSYERLSSGRTVGLIDQ